MSYIPNLSTNEVARRLGVTSRTIRYWITEGLIKPDSVTKRGFYKFSHETVSNIADSMKFKNGDTHNNT